MQTIKSLSFPVAKPDALTERREHAQTGRQLLQQIDDGARLRCGVDACLHCRSSALWRRAVQTSKLLKGQHDKRQMSTRAGK